MCVFLVLHHYYAVCMLPVLAVGAGLLADIGRRVSGCGLWTVSGGTWDRLRAHVMMSVAVAVG